jgi:hypothetical protein
MKESMAKHGYTQGDMTPKVEDYEAPASGFGEEGFSKTLDYIERQDSFRSKAASKIKSQSYEGRYS